jgi:hypothetical protein
MPGRLRRKAAKWIEGKWGKRTAVFIVIALWAIATREIAPHYNLSKWTVTGVSTVIFYFAFWLADRAWGFDD